MVALGTAVVAILVGVLVVPVSSSIVAKQFDTGAQLDTAWWLAVAPSVALFATVVGVAVTLGMKGDHLRVLVGVGMSLPFTAALQVLTARHQQRLAWRALATGRIIGTIVGTAGALTLLVLDEPLLALIALQTLSALAQVVAMAPGTNWRVRLRTDPATRRLIVSYAKGLAGFNALNFLIRKGDDVIVGTFLSAQALGLYSVAYRFIEVPVGQVSQVASNVTFPTLMKIDDEARMRAAFLRSQKMLVWLVVPIGIASVGLGDLGVPALLGAQWQDAGPIVQIFGVIAIVQAAGTQLGVIYLYRSATGTLLRWGLLSAPIIVTGFLVGSEWGARGVAWGYLAANLVLLYPSWWFGGRLIGLPPRVVLRSLLGQLILAAGGIALLVGAREVVALESVLALIAATAASSLLFWSMALALDTELRQDIRRTALGRFGEARPQASRNHTAS